MSARDRAPLPERLKAAVGEIVRGNLLVGVLAVLLALVAGSVLIVATDKEVQASAAYFFARPLDTLSAIWASIANAYSAFFQGAFYNFRREGFAAGIKPLTETLVFATPLILGGLGVALTFRAGLFNIGGRGQMLMGAAFGAWIGFALPLPGVLHPILALVVGALAGAIWGGIAGLLKAYTGAHEVITTIMLNYVAFYLVFWMLSTKGLLQAPGSNNPKSPAMLETVVLPRILGDGYRLHVGFLIAVVAVVVVWWLVERSSLGFRLRAVGLNPRAAQVAGISVGRITTVAMMLSGGLLGLAGVNQAIGTETSGLTSGIDAGIGFDAITVALLGQSKAVGVLLAGILLGAFKAGGYSMQSSGVPIDIVTVIQSLIVLFLAAPPLVRAIFGIPQPGSRRRRRSRTAVTPSTEGAAE